MGIKLSAALLAGALLLGPASAGVVEMHSGRRALAADGNAQYRPYGNDAIDASKDPPTQYRPYGNDAIDASKDPPTQYRPYGNDAIDASKDQPTQYRPYGNDAIDASGDESDSVDPPPLQNYDELYYPEETDAERETTQTPPNLVRVATDGSIVEDQDAVFGRRYCFANPDTMENVYCT